MINKQKTIWFFFFFVLQVAMLFANEGQYQKFKRSFSAEGVNIIDLVCEQGIVTFVAIDGNEFTFDEEYRSTRSAEAEVADGVFCVRIDRSRFSGRFTRKKITWSWYYEATIGIPRSYNGDINIRFGDGVLHFENDFEPDGTITVTMDGADFNAKSLIAISISIDAPYGDITVLNVSGHLTATAKREEIIIEGNRYSGSVTIDG
jgi:hypothetical protein